MANGSMFNRLLLAAGIAVSLGACGGGGGGGVAFIPAPPAPPPAPPAPPPPPPKPAPIGFIHEPLRATAGTGTPVFAKSGGPNFDTAVVGTTFPMLQTALELYGNGWFQVENPDSKAVVEAGGVRVDMADATTTITSESLDWTRAGYWQIPTDWYARGSSHGVFVVGYETPAAAVPATGTASYSGAASGWAFTTEIGPSQLSGNASLTANFGARTVSGNLTGMMAGSDPWNSVAFTSTILGNGFSGTTSVTTAPPGFASLAANAMGTLEGRFFGPSAQEAGAVWTLFDGRFAAFGTFTAARQ